MKVYGANVSPYVRKVRVYCTEKSLPFEVDPVIPMGVSEEYKKLNPQEKVRCGSPDPPHHQLGPSLRLCDLGAAVRGG